MEAVGFSDISIATYQSARCQLRRPREYCRAHVWTSELRTVRESNEVYARFVSIMYTHTHSRMLCRRAGAASGTRRAASLSCSRTDPRRTAQTATIFLFRPYLFLVSFSFPPHFSSHPIFLRPRPCSFSRFCFFVSEQSSYCFYSSILFFIFSS